MERIEGLYIGGIAPLGERASAIVKHAVEAADLTPLGLLGDAQADRINHGGPERALLQYCARHYAVWERELPGVDDLRAPGFGENLSASSMDEDGVCIGDIYGIGAHGVRVQVSQPRTPCAKLDARFDTPGLARRVLETIRCGWLHRVQRPGRIAVGDAIELLERPHPGMTVAAVMGAVHAEAPDVALLERIAGLDALSANWRAKAQRRLDAARLPGEPT